MSSLRIALLGGVSFQLNDQPLTSLTAIKAQALLIYLAATGRPHARASLAGLLWSDVLETAAHNSLRVTLAQLRQSLGDYIDATRQSIALVAKQPLWLDITEFVQACSRLHSIEASIEESEYHLLRAGVHLYHGDFVSGFYIPYAELFEEWMTAERAYCTRLARDALIQLGTLALRRGAYSTGIEDVQRSLMLDPSLEEAHQLLMQLYTHNGQTTLALRQYEICVRELEQELGVSPAAETVALLEAIRTRTLAAPEPPVRGVHSLAAYNDNEAIRPPHHNLPHQTTVFIGRTTELATLADMLANPHCRLITLLGPGGTGKTRLALQAASDKGKAFADGTTFVALAPLDAAEFIAPTVAAALDFTLISHAAPETELVHYLRQKELLLVLDNFEHLLAPHTLSSVGNGNATELLSSILQQALGVKMVVTSRERLNVQGEWIFDVGGLEIPTGAYQAGEQPSSELEAYSAMALFLQTARRVQQGFEPTAADQAAIVRICQLVQGVPLALELAAAWVRVLSCREIADEIGQSLGFLTTTLRDLPERHRSLQAVFDHSWKLLSVEEQHVFACCSVFRRGFTRESAAEVAGASLPVLAALVDKSLLRRQLNGRYEVHELARQYAAARLAEVQQVVQTRNRHLVYFMRFAETAEPQIRSGDTARWHEWVENEHDNLRAALDWALSGGEFERGLRIVGALGEFWMNRGHALEGKNQAERFLARPEAASHTLLRAKALVTAGNCNFFLDLDSAAFSWYTEAAAIGRELGASGKYIVALAVLGQAHLLSDSQEFDFLQALSKEVLSLGEELEDLWVKAHALNLLGDLARQRGDYMTAQQQFLESLQCFQADGHSVMRGTILRRLGAMLSEKGDYALAHVYLSQGLAIFEELGDRGRSNHALRQLGQMAMSQGHDEEAEEYLIKALLFTRETSRTRNRIDSLDALGRLAQRQGDYTRARTLHEESLTLCIEMDHPARLALALEAFACLAARLGQPAAAVRLFGATDAHSAPMGAPIEPYWRLEHDHLVASARAQLGEAKFAAAWAAGAAMTLDEAVTLTEAPRSF